MIRVLVALLALILGTTIWAHWPDHSLDLDARADRVVILKSQRVLELYSGGTLLKSYKVSLGSNPLGPKSQQGDGRTPEGTYQIDYHKADSSFHKALHISYPSASDRAGSAGRDPGGLIMVHGLRNGLGWLGRVHRVADWTDGCVAVTNPEIDEIYRAVSDGTIIELRP